MENERALVPRQPPKLHKTNQQLAIRHQREYQADQVPHISIEDVRRMAAQVKERDQLLIRLLFDGCLRASEAVSVRPKDIEEDVGWLVRILGKGDKWGSVAISPSLAAQLQAYAYRKGIPFDQRIFPITRYRVHQIVSRAMERAGVSKPAHVGAVHVLRHSGAIERLRQTGNPKALQDQLRHKSAAMTLRYLKTLSQQESLRIQEEVDLRW